jgi:hypothetical protein
MLSRLAPFVSVLCVAAVALAASAVPATAGDEAVSDINIKLDGFAGLKNGGDGSKGFYGSGLSIAMPIEHHFAVQFDTSVAGQSGDHYFYDIGAHMFWRNASTGMLGVYLGMARAVPEGPRRRMDHFGIEGERYLDNITYRGALGYEHGNTISNVYGHAKVDYFLSPNLMTSGGVTFEAGRLFYSSRTELQFRTDQELGLGVYASSDFNSVDAFRLSAGLTLTIGEPMTLRDRQRHQNLATYQGVDMLGTELER